MTDETKDYPRAREARTVDAAIGAGDIDFETLGYPKEWWDERDRKVREQLAQATANHEHAMLLQRAGELRDNGFPELFVTAALGDLEDTTAMKAARTFKYMPKRMIAFGGGVGCGKTTAATYIALKGEDPRPGFVRVSELERRGRYDRDFDDWLSSKTSLVVDDLGSEYMDGKGAFRSLMDHVVDMFYADRRTLVMTTNLRPRKTVDTDEDQLYERYGERVWSRLNQSGLWVDCGTRDLRKEPPR